MITSIGLENFKSVKKLELQLGRLVTVLIGPNGSGKSSIIQAVNVLTQSCLAGGFETRGKLLDLGPPDSLVNQESFEQGSKYASITVRGESAIPEGPLQLGNKVLFTYEIRFDSKGLLWHKGICDTTTQMSFVASFGRDMAPQVNPTEVRIGDLKCQLSAAFDMGYPIVIKSLSSPPGKDYESRNLENQLRALFATARNNVVNVYAVPSTRGFDHYQYALLKEPTDRLLNSEGTTVQAQKAVSTLAYFRELEPKISDWSKKITDVEISAHLVPPQQVAVHARQRFDVNIMNEGFGTNQISFLLLQLARAPGGCMVTIEEPEIHLHPRAQGRLVEVLMDVAKTERKRTLITTHSEHIIFRLLTQLAEGKLSPDDVAIYAFDKQEGATQYRKLAVDEKGRIEGGLSGFLETDIEEFGKYLKAVTGRSRA